MLYFHDNSDRAAEEISVAIHDNSNHDKSTHFQKSPLPRNSSRNQFGNTLGYIMQERAKKIIS